MNESYKAPLYIQIENLIERKITSGEYLPGTKLPGERKLAEQYGVNRMTVKKAINNLVLRSLLVRKEGSGTFVKGHGMDDKYYFDLAFGEGQSAASMTEVLNKRGITISNRVLGTQLIHNEPYFERKLSLSAGSPVFALHRVREADGSPFAVEYNYLPANLLPNIQQARFQEIGLYDYLNSQGHRVAHVLQRTQFLPAMDAEASLLNIEAGTIIYKIQYLSSDTQGNMIEYAESYLNPDEVSLNFTLGAKTIAPDID